MSAEKPPKRILLLEDVDSDAELTERELRRTDLSFVVKRVEREEDYRKTLSEFEPDIILADYHLPAFDGISALRIAASTVPDVPFIFVSGSIGEERAIEALKEGATDYILKDRLARLGPAVVRALDDSEERRERVAADTALKTSEWRLSEFMRATHHGIWEVDITAGTAWISESYRNILLYAQESPFVTTQWWFEKLHPEEAPGIGKQLDDFLAGSEEIIQLAYRFRRGDGSFAHLRDRILVIRDREGRGLRMMGGIVDETRDVESQKLERIRSNVNLVLIESLTTEEAIPRLLETMCSSLDWEAGIFWRLDPEASLLRCAAVRPPGSKEIHRFLDACQVHTLLPGQGVAGKVWQTRTPEITAVDSDEPLIAGYARSAELKETCAFSVGTDHVVGVMQFFDCRIGTLDRATLGLISEIGGHIGQFFDRREAERSLKQLFEIERLIASISSRFVNLETSKVDDGIYAALQAVGVFLNADVSHLFLFSEDGKSVSKTHEWTAQPIFPPIENFQNLSLELFPTVGPYLASGEVQAIDDVSTLPEAAPEKQFFLGQNLRGVVVIPTIHSGKLIGFCGVATLAPRHWSEQAITLLRVVGELIGNAVGRREAERALLENQARLEEAEELAHVGHWEWNVVTNELRFSNEVYRFYGLDPSSVPDFGQVIAALHPEDADLATTVREDLERGEKIREFRYRIKHSDGRYRILEGRGQGTFDSDGTLVRIFGTTRDITDQVHFIEKIETLTRQYESIFESARDGIVAVDQDGYIATVNRAALEAIDATLENATQLRGHDLFHHSRADGSPYPWEECPIMKTLQDGVTREIRDEVFWRRDGTSFPVEYAVTPLQNDETVSGSLVIFRDVSERKLIQQQLAQANTLSSLGRMASTIAHEFNNVLMGIQPAAELVRRKSNEPRVVKAGEQIIKSV